MSDQDGLQESGNRAALQQQFAEWLLLTPSGRSEAGLPAKQRGMAELLGVSQATLSTWKKDAKFQRMMNRHVRANFGADRLGKVIDSLYEVAVNSNEKSTAAAQVSAAKTLLGWYEASDTQVDAADLEQMSTEELRALAQRVLADSAGA